jgi:transposase-like protein
VGHPCQPEYGVEPEPEDLHQDRGLAEPRIEAEHPYLYLDGIVMKRSWAGEVRNVSLLVASAANSEGFREILGICEGAKEDKSGWSAFLKACSWSFPAPARALSRGIADFLPEAHYQRCVVHRNVFGHVPSTRVREVSHMLKGIHARRAGRPPTTRHGRSSTTCGQARRAKQPTSLSRPSTRS